MQGYCIVACVGAIKGPPTIYSHLSQIMISIFQFSSAIDDQLSEPLLADLGKNVQANIRLRPIGPVLVGNYSLSKKEES